MEKTESPAREKFHELCWDLPKVGLLYLMYKVASFSTEDLCYCVEVYQKRFGELSEPIRKEETA